MKKDKLVALAIFVSFLFLLRLCSPFYRLIMSIHISAKQGDIADKILLPGDPLRAKFIAENFLEDAVCSTKYVTCLVTQEHTRVNVSQ